MDRASPSESTPWPICLMRVPPASSTMPKPQYLEPGSIPRTRMQTAIPRYRADTDLRRAGFDGRDLLVGDLEVRVHELDVVILFQALDQAEHLLGNLTGDLHRGLGQV